MIDVYATILENSFKTSTPFIDTVFNETLGEFLPLGDIAVVGYDKLLTFATGSMKTTLVFPIQDTPTDTITLRLKCKHLTP